MSEEPQNKTVRSVDRRSAMVLIGIFAISLTGIGTTVFLRIRDNLKRRNGDRGFEIGSIDELVTGPNVNSLYRVVVYKERSANGTWLLSAISLTCTHQVCLLNTEADGFSCPCHGSRFSQEGKVLRGPATKSLPWFRLARNAFGNLQIFPQDVVDANWRLEI